MFISKNCSKSKTINGVVVALLGYLMSHGWIPAVDPELVANHLMVIGGSVFAIYGRFKAKAKITLAGKK